MLRADELRSSVLSVGGGLSLGVRGCGAKCQTRTEGLRLVCGGLQTAGLLLVTLF